MEEKPGGGGGCDYHTILMTFCCELFVVTKRIDYSHNHFSICQDNAAGDNILSGWANSSLTLLVERLHGYLHIAYWTNTRKSPLAPQLSVYYWDQIGSMPKGKKEKGMSVPTRDWSKWRLPHRQGCCFSQNRKPGSRRCWPPLSCLRILPGTQVLFFPLGCWFLLLYSSPHSCKMAVLTSRFLFHIQDLKGS